MCAHLTLYPLYRWSYPLGPLEWLKIYQILYSIRNSVVLISMKNKNKRAAWKILQSVSTGGEAASRWKACAASKSSPSCAHKLRPRRDLRFSQQKHDQLDKRPYLKPLNFAKYHPVVIICLGTPAHTLTQHSSYQRFISSHVSLGRLEPHEVSGERVLVITAERHVLSVIPYRKEGDKKRRRVSRRSEMLRGWCACVKWLYKLDGH